MLDSLSYFVGILGTVVGVAGAVALVVLGLVCTVIIRRLPQKLRRVMSAIAASMVVFTIFRELSIQNISFLYFKSITASDIIASIADAYFLIIVLSVLLSQAFVRYDRVSSFEVELFEDLCCKQSAHIADISEQSLVLKATSVILQ